MILSSQGDTLRFLGKFGLSPLKRQEPLFHDAGMPGFNRISRHGAVPHNGLGQSNGGRFLFQQGSLNQHVL